MKMIMRVRAFPTVAVCILAVVTTVSVALVLRWRSVNSSIERKAWNSISNVRIDFGEMVTNRIFNIGAKDDPVKAELVMMEMYFHENDFVLPFKGRMACFKGTCDCSMELRAPVLFKEGAVYAGELMLGTFSPYGIDLGKDEKFVAGTLFAMIKNNVKILPFEVDKEFKAIHSINNDFIEFEK